MLNKSIVGGGGGRNASLDLLRIVSMLMVVILHVTGDGGILLANRNNFLSYNSVFFLRSFSYCAVNCFAMITGYCMIESDYKVAKFFNHWLQVFFYCLLITICFISVPYFKENYPLTKKQIITSFFPIMGDGYWYFTAYAVLFFFIPYLNEFIKTLDRKKLETLLLLCFLFFSVLPFICLKDIFKVYHTFMWLVVFYFLGAYLKYYNVKIPIKISLLCIFASNISVLLLEIFGRWFLRRFFHKETSLGFLLVKNDSPFVVLHSVSFFLLFLSFQIKDNLKLVRNMSKVSFDVYLLHANPLIYNAFIKKGRFSFVESGNPLLVISVALGISLAIYIVCSVVGFLRMMLFKILHIDLISQKLNACSL